MEQEYREKMSQQHYDAEQQRLSYLKGTRRTEVADALAEARSHGDLSENAEYDEARNEQARLEDEIKKLEYTLEHAEIISTLSSDTVSTGCGVILSRAEFNGQPQKIETLQIVGRSEADYENHKISDDSPIGKAVLGKRVGDTFIVEAPIGIMTFTVLEISSTGVFENHPEG
ncbi:MAG: transcription elongation factor GreA [Oscillospiraceae bacterium]|jgi:transcription elongation factor GreA|nr:transcription elongation factor GreA [Oscillospiraceae bacterium]MBQ9908088.1 transcription elongation factor GreA [Oscillospiraceae bacterium]MBR5364468.1 transcription elongation factor GreA [Oscillospiraceae bacterium]